MSNPTARRGIVAAAHVYYIIVAFEFFYMVSPFAAYLYGIYAPGLDFIAASPMLSWLNTFYLPHIVIETNSAFINAHNGIGAVLLTGGLIAFIVGVVQIYGSKLRKGAEVVGGMYRHIRHPQYLALIIAGLGMTFIWPRFLVLVGFVTIACVYVILARVEERMCMARFPGYADYMSRTGRFLPQALEMRMTPRISARSRAGRFSAAALAYGLALAFAMSAGLLLQARSIAALPAVYTDSAAYLALRNVDQPRIDSVARIAEKDHRVAAALAAARGSADVRLINYVLPAEFHVSEIPMYIPEGEVAGHGWPAIEHPQRFKIVFTRIDSRPGAVPSGSDIVKRALNKHPIVEVHVDLAATAVIDVRAPPAHSFYGGMPVPVY